MDATIIDQLDRLLLRMQLHTPTGDVNFSSEQQRVFNQICKLVFTDHAYRSLWDEAVLARLDWLFSLKSPQSTVYGTQLAELRARAVQVRKINDCFFRILHQDGSLDEVAEALSILSQDGRPAPSTFNLTEHVHTSRGTDAPPSKRITAFLTQVEEGARVALLNREDINGCLQSLSMRECPGRANALLVKATEDEALVVPLEIKLQSGTGQVKNVVHDREDFKKAIDRARHALVDLGFLKASEDVLCTLDLTEAQYVGSSIGLAAAVSIYEAARGRQSDPYTAFTGDINLQRNQWRVHGVRGISAKLKAARLRGCRRIFIPRENFPEVESVDQSELQIIPVDDLLELFRHLQAPLQPLPGDSLQARKMNSLTAFCQNRGWQLSAPRPIQGGLQFRTAPPLLQACVINLYDTGTHAPKHHERQEYEELLHTLQALEDPDIPLRKVERRLTIQDPALRADIQQALAQLPPTEQRQEAYCEYVFRFEQGQEQLVVKQYHTGTLHLQGTAGPLYKAVLECIVPPVNLRFPNANLSVEAMLEIPGTPSRTLGAVSSPQPAPAVHDMPLPYIGTDESGKGDYFGPMVVAAVLVDAQTKPKLEALGVKDSKLLSDKRCRELAAQIRELCRGRFQEVEIAPERYNELYESLRNEGKNLNHLLAWGHARAIESLLERFSCSHAVADQFGDEHYIRSRLMEKGRQLQLIQVPKGERYLAVAAASILTRDRFVTRLEKVSQEYGITIPKGASDAVIAVAKQIVKMKGAEELRRVVKLHHQTTQKVLG